MVQIGQSWIGDLARRQRVHPWNWTTPESIANSKALSAL